MTNLSEMTADELAAHIAELHNFGYGLSDSSMISSLIDCVYELHRRMAAIEAVNPTVYTFDKSLVAKLVMEAIDQEMADC